MWKASPNAPIWLKKQKKNAPLYCMNHIEISKFDLYTNRKSVLSFRLSYLKIGDFSHEKKAKRFSWPDGISLPSQSLLQRYEILTYLNLFGAFFFLIILFILTKLQISLYITFLSSSPSYDYMNKSSFVPNQRNKRS